MVTRQIDARGMNCPLPVVNTKKVLDDMDQGEIVTLVDNEAARDNLVKLAEALHCGVSVEQKGNDYQVFIKKGSVTDLPTHLDPEHASQAFFVTSNTLGKGSEELGAVLIKSLFYSLTQSDHLPQIIVFVNSGVYLACEGSAVMEYLLELERHGVEIISCGTCLDFYNMKRKLCVGSVTNMYTILERLSLVEKTLTI
ncbi:sulfurtransferase-like selenium metabolism protein YedF [Candidatus Formimonas warabiya]|uniref:SirA family protein n=1 Tax=Formimonas warabiya TaxID=1761012 RepID=A0A3G1KVI4_FORW1|nr:sulfurtransferase-like selenium metabolism protein YedF [Candidatus Formimonas warabiya]ATW26235.1 SirA family protein [Candidatus Formimonas warabiya]